MRVGRLLTSGGRTAGFSAPDRRIPQGRAAWAIHLSKNSGNRHIEVVKAGRESCSQFNERSVFRATVLSIVLTLVAGPNASVLCKAWCDPAAAAAAGCHHTDSSPSATLTGADDCGQAVPNGGAVVQERARRGAPSSDPQQAVMVARHVRSISSSDAHPGDAPRFTWPLTPRPLVTALRI